MFPKHINSTQGNHCQENINIIKLYIKGLVKNLYITISRPVNRIGPYSETCIGLKPVSDWLEILSMNITALMSE